MKAALFYGGRDIRVEERPVPEPGPREVLVRVRAAGICGSDLHGYRRPPGPPPGSSGGAPAPVEGAQRPTGEGEQQRQRVTRGGVVTGPSSGDAPAGRENGHELAGEVAALGPGVTGLAVGQRVGIEPEHLVGCGACPYCARGDTHLCRTRGHLNGRRLSSHGFSEYDVCLSRNVHPLPDGVSTDAAAILDCYACAVHAVHRLPITPFATVAVIGTGAIGMNVGQVARAAGARRVIMVGTREEPLAIARAAGAADETVAASAGDPVAALLDLTGGEGADVVFETVGGTAPTLDQAIRAARRGGAVGILGMYTATQALDTTVAYGKELTLRWSNSYATWQGRSEYAIALDLLAGGRVQAGPLITHHFPLARIAEAFAAADDKRASGAIKVLVHA